MQEQIKLYIQDCVKNLFQIDSGTIELSQPPKKDLGDYAYGTFLLAKELKKSPIEIAQTLKQYIEDDVSQNFIDKVEVAGPYMNIYISSGNFFQEFIKSQKKEKNTKKTDKIIIDYIGANVGKPLHIGHMCTPNIGQVLINAHRKLGYDVIGDSHIGDWGIIFGKLITAYNKYGDEKQLHENAVKHLFELYVQISSEAEKEELLEQEFRDTFKKLSEGNSEMVKLWSEFTRYSISSMDYQLGRLGITPDYHVGESFYEGIGLPKMGDYPDLQCSMSEIVEELIKKGIATKNDDGSVGVEFEEQLKIPSCILQKRDGTHGYLASDLATIKYRMDNWNPDKIIYSVDVRQQLHLRQVFIISDLAGWTERNGKEKTELFHAYNGFISLKDGAMSTRKGRIIKLEDLLDEAERRAGEIIQEKRTDIQGEELLKLAKIIGIGAIKYGYLKKSRETDVVFDWDEFMSFEGNSGPYIQYAYVRAKNLLLKAENIDYTNISNPGSVGSDMTNLAIHISSWKSILEKSMETYHPHILCNYLYELAKLFNAFYNNESILSEEDEIYKNKKLYLVESFSQNMEQVFQVLGIELPEKM